MGQINVKAKKNIYIIAFKLKCIQKVKPGVSIHKIEEEAGIYRASIKDWMRQKDEILQKDHKQIVLDKKDLIKL